MSLPEPVAPDFRLDCPNCGYDQHGITSDRCPECGTPIDRNRPAHSRIPWENRRVLGRVRAYRRTAWWVLVRIKALAGESSRSVSYVEAQRFRWITVGLVFLAIACMTALTLAVQSPGDRVRAMKDFASGFVVPTDMQAWVMPLAFVGFFLALVLVTGVPSYFFHRRPLRVEQQNAAIALSYYGSGMLLWIVMPVLVMWIGFIVFWFLDVTAQKSLENAAVAGFLAMEIATILLTLAWWWKLMRLLRLTTRCGLIRQLALGLAMVLCVSLGIGIVLGLPSLAGYVMILLR